MRMSPKSYPSLGVAVVLPVILTILAACATTPPPPETVAKPKPARLYYTLRAGKPVVQREPLPTRTDIYVDWHYDNGKTKAQKGFRGWDFDGSGNFGMLEVLGEDGQPQHYIFDFLGDGHPQLTVDE